MVNSDIAEIFDNDFPAVKIFVDLEVEICGVGGSLMIQYNKDQKSGKIVLPTNTTYEELSDMALKAWREYRGELLCSSTASYDYMEDWFVCGITKLDKEIQTADEQIAPGPHLLELGMTMVRPIDIGCCVVS